MPFINGKFYMNPAYGRALENARANGPTDEDQGGHRVTIKGHHVLIEEAQGGRTQHNNPKHAGHSVNRANSKPGIKASRIIFNETSGLQPANRNSVDLHDARVAMAHARSNGESMSHPPSTVSDTLTSTASRAILTDAKAKAAWTDSAAAVQEAAASSDNTNGAVHFFLDYQNADRPDWATEDRETANYGPFVNAAGGGDVPRGALVTIRIYSDKDCTKCARSE